MDRNTVAEHVSGRSLGGCSPQELGEAACAPYGPCGFADIAVIWRFFQRKKRLKHADKHGVTVFGVFHQKKPVVQVRRSRGFWRNWLADLRIVSRPGQIA